MTSNYPLHDDYRIIDWWTVLGVVGNVLAICMPYAVIKDKSPGVVVTHHLHLADTSGADDLSRASTWDRTVRWLSALLLVTNVFQIWLRTAPFVPPWVFCSGCVLSAIVGTLGYPFLAHLTYIDGGDYGVETGMGVGGYLFVIGSVCLPIRYYYAATETKKKV